MARAAAAPTTRTLALHDGRHLAYAESGAADGRPLVFLHGWCGSRLTRHPDDALTASLGVRLITVDRPGVGGSDRQPGRRLLDWPDDLAQVAEALALERFAVLGHSAGGPHALACGVRIPERISRLGVVCGFAPMDRPGATEGMASHMRQAVSLFSRLPWLARPMVRSLPGQYRRDARAAWAAQFGRDLCAADRAALQGPGVRDNLLDAACEAVRGGSRGIADEVPLFLGRPWGFRPEQVRAPTWLWYGAADTFTPVQMGRYLASAIPSAQLVTYPGEGHMVYLSHWAEMLVTLAA